MPFTDLRDTIASLKSSGDLYEVEEELSPKYELSSFLWLASLTMEKAVLFRKVKGYDIPVVANVTFSRKVISLGMDVKLEELVAVFTQRIKTPIEPKIVTEAPVKEKVVPTVNLIKALPLLTHYAGDSSAFITTGLVSARNPDSGVISRGIYRMELRGKDELGIALHNPPVADIYQKYKDKGELLPVAVVIGVEPITFLANALIFPPGVDKMTIAGGLRGSPVDVSPSAVFDIPVPAHAEFLLEGELDAKDERQDGPLGEISGYYLTIPKTPTFKVKRISHRVSPFYHALLPTGKEADLLLTFAAEASFSPRLRELFPFVLDFHFIPRTFGSSIVVRVKETGREHIRSLILHLLSLGMVKKVVVVDEKVKADEPEEVEWAIITRCQPDKDSLVMTGLKGQAIDPSCSETGQTAKLGIDATGFDSVKGYERVSFPKGALSRMQSLLKSENASAERAGNTGNEMRIKGKMFSGTGEGAFFTQLDWVKEQCQAKLEFLPSPGTLNLYVNSQSLDILKKLRDAEGISLIPPTPEFCQAKCFPVLIGSIRGAIIIPQAEQFTDKVHPPEVIEIIAPVNIKESLPAKDGDEIWVELETL